MFNKVIVKKNNTNNKKQCYLPQGTEKLTQLSLLFAVKCKQSYVHTQNCAQHVWIDQLDFP